MTTAAKFIYGSFTMWRRGLIASYSYHIAGFAFEALRTTDFLV